MVRPPALVARGLRVEGPGGRPLVDDVGLSVAPGEVLAVVGGSGAGKTLAALALIGLVPPPARRTGGTVELDGVALPADGAALRRVRGAGIAYVPQDPAAALDPVRRVGEQVAETLRAHRPMGRAEARARAAAALADLGVVRDDHPHRLSGGQRQRALLAMALAPGPRVLVADEPTASLDAPVQVEVLDLLARRGADGLAVVLVTHDLGAVARVADRVAVMDAGRIVEEGPVRRVLTAPRHPATAALVAAVPRPPAPRPPRPAGPPLLEARGVVRVHRARSGDVRALDGADLTVGEGEVVGLVGASGSGKTTLGRMMVRLDTPTEGSVAVAGRDLASVDAAGLLAARKSVGMVFQDPYLSLDPRLSVEAAIAEPMRIHGLGGASRADRRAARGERVPELLDAVGIDPALARRRPATLSGGQRQRVALARALALEPRALVLDEPVSSLDAATGARVVALLEELRERRGLSYLLISHDLAAVAAVADRVVVMDAGRIVESGAPARLLSAPGHPATRALARAAQDLSLVPWS